MSNNRLTMAAILLLICTLIAILSSMNASAYTTVSISGHVRDQDNKSVQQAIVTLYYNKTPVAVSGNPAQTDSNGNYQISGIKSDIYSLEVEKYGYSYTETVMINETNVVINVTLPGHTAALVTTPSPIITPTPVPSPTPPPTARPTNKPTSVPTASPTAIPTPGFEALIALAGIGLAIAVRKS